VKLFRDVYVHYSEIKYQNFEPGMRVSNSLIHVLPNVHDSGMRISISKAISEQQRL
ncbi:1862_t:CDS:1, partial [Racocetra persica]